VIIMSDTFTPALGFHILTPLYQTIVDIFCRDSHVKNTIVSSVAGRDMRILDIACGPGKLVRLLAEKQACCQIIGRDLDPRMVAAARASTADLENVSIDSGDCTVLAGIDSDSVDIVVESLVFHHLTDSQKEAATKEIKRVLRPGGLFYFVDWVKPETMATKIGFRIIELVDGIDTTESHKNNAVLRMISTHLAQLPDAKRIQTTCGTIGIIKFQK
jgi:ubiquinone/menaquinone biosynthesis C-methylase UbiE